jgi:hypothetical protein
VIEWRSLTLIEQTLMRGAFSGHRLANQIHHYGEALRWTGSADSLPHSYTTDEVLALVPRFSEAALGLAARGLLFVREAAGPWAQDADPTLSGHVLAAVLTEPGSWIWEPGTGGRYFLDAPRAVRERWWTDALPAAEIQDLPDFGALSKAQREILVCAVEGSGMLTGMFGIWDDPPGELEAAERAAWIDRQLAPLTEFVHKGWIEVRYLPGDGSYTVIPLEALSEAFADPVLRLGGDDMFIGATCVFTLAGRAVWRRGWSRDWNRVLRIE